MSTDLTKTKEELVAELKVARRELAEFKEVDGKRNHSEKILQESEERYSQLSDATFEAIFLSQQGRCIGQNRTAERMFGISFEEALGRMGMEWIHPDYRELVKEKMLTGYEDAYEAVAQRKDGSTFPCEIQARRVEEDGKSVRITALRDITKRKQVEEALRESEKRFQNLMEHIPGVSVQGYGTDGTIFYWNKASETIYGYTAEETLGRNLADLIIPDELRPFFLENLKTSKTLRESGEFMPAGDVELLHKDGHFVSVHSIHTCVCTKGRSPLLFCIDVDLSEYKQAKETLKIAKEKAEAANRAKSEFLANMSHEIRTPLNGVMGMLQLIQMTPSDEEEEQKGYIQAAMRSSEVLRDLLSDILDLSKVEAGKLEVLEEIFDLRALVQEVSEIFLLQLSKKNLILHSDIDIRIPALLKADRLRLKQVLVNIVGNAVKFTSQGAVRLKVSLAEDQPETGPIRIVFTVLDTGIGIPGDRLENIFEPFTQVDGSYTRKYGGTGLGLAIVKRLVEMMGGTVQVESEVGVGTMVRVEIPVTEVEPTSSSEKPILSEAMKSVSNLHILLAEDDFPNQLVAKRMLEKQGHTVFCVATGKEALEAVKFERYDIILMDVQMPEMDGIEATIEIRKDGRFNNLPIIALTAHAMAGDREIFLEAGMDDYLTKPIDVEELKKVLARVRGK